MLKFILVSYSFRRILILTGIFTGFLFIFSKIFDQAWGSSSSIPIVNLYDVYSVPEEYDNNSNVNLKQLSKDLIAIEGNKKFRVIGHQTDPQYYDTVKVVYPDTSYNKINKIFLKFEDSDNLDSIYIVISNSQEEKLYYNQVFYSSVIIQRLNKFSEEPDEFRIDNTKLVNKDLLQDNDTLINEVFNYFNTNIAMLGIADCGKNCTIFLQICNNFGVPGRIVSLQGGDIDQVGYNDKLGYPLHVVCEIYSSRHQKWYVVDPTYGFRFKHKVFQDYLNAVEISYKHTFRREDNISQDSILITKRTLVGRDYFQFYENVIFSKPEWKNRFLKKLVRVFYSNFDYYIFLFSNNFSVVKNGFYYVGIKTFMYFFMLILYINVVLFLLLKRLFLVKKPKY